ncbi:MAG TPA: hypothetical protein EYP59_11490 [Thiotrichaceae bacterium]|nr:hypothetical protein [Thiotrichaceae bacterium]
MTTSTDFWFRTLFQLKIYKVSGEEFQRLFEDIMEYRYPDFQSVAPWGNWGDGGNDGWIPSEKRYFQVYGPKINTPSNPVKATEKLIEDFQKLKHKWSDIECYHFVYNDRFNKMPAPIGKALADLQNQYHLQEATPFSAGKLEKTFMALTDDQKMMIVGGIPAEIPDSIDPRAIGELLSHLADQETQMLNWLNETAPHFQEKIKFNGLSQPISGYLNSYSYQTQYIDDFLQYRDIGLAQICAVEIHSIYLNSQKEIPDKTENAPNLRYVWMIEQLIPPVAHNHPHTLKAYREAAQVILAKYFESCDAYEHPNSITTS